MMWWSGPGWGMFWMGLGSLLWLVLLGLAIWLLIRWLTRSAPPATPGAPPVPPPSALEILKQRYARGEIDTPTFEAMRERLQAMPEYDEHLQHV